MDCKTLQNTDHMSTLNRLNDQIPSQEEIPPEPGYAMNCDDQTHIAQVYKGGQVLKQVQPYTSRRIVF